MKILVACEESQEVTKAFRAKGHEAYSCDIQDCSGGHPEWHLRGDAMQFLSNEWDLLIAHPPCTYLTSRAQYWNKAKDRMNERDNAIEFFKMFVNATHIKRRAIENPVGIMSTLHEKPTQIIHPFYFGDPFEKKTCLWLYGLPNLTYDYKTQVEPKGAIYVGKNGRKLYWHDALPKSSNRAKIKSKTFPGIAQAMADQWG